MSYEPNLHAPGCVDPFLHLPYLSNTWTLWLDRFCPMGSASPSFYQWGCLSRSMASSSTQKFLLEHRYIKFPLKYTPETGFLLAQLVPPTKTMLGMMGLGKLNTKSLLRSQTDPERMRSWTVSMGVLSCGTCGLSTLTRDWTGSPALGVWSLSHWATKEVPKEMWS